MKLDMHCHVKEGSVDSKIGIEEYMKRLEELGFDGMLVTDHDTYEGYRCWKRQIKGKTHTGFVVLKGIEYDTCDGGHILCIMPEGVKMRLLELRGLPVAVLIDFVHRNGGILGPAHPCGEKYMSFARTKRYCTNPELMKRFDFFETFNACEPPENNDQAAMFAARYKKPGIGGSDAHKFDCIGAGYTILPKRVATESELIHVLRAKEGILAGGSFYTGTTREKMGRAGKLLAYSFWIYNKGGALLKRRRRRQKEKIENPDGMTSAAEDETA